MRYYFLGIGGIGMSAIARYFKAKGFDVAGYDRTSTVLTRELEVEGIEVNYVDEVDEIATQYRDVANTLVVFTPAIPADSLELDCLRKKNVRIIKRANKIYFII